MTDDVTLNKIASIERCLARIGQEYRGHESELTTNLTRQDSIILNLLRACEAAIDLAMHGARVRRLGIPQQSRDAFDMLHEAGVIDADLARRMKAMVGFRNIAIHNYQEIDLEIVRSIIDDRLGDFGDFCHAMLAAAGT